MLRQTHCWTQISIVVLVRSQAFSLLWLQLFGISQIYHFFKANVYCSWIHFTLLYSGETWMCLERSEDDQHLTMLPYPLTMLPYLDAYNSQQQKITNEEMFTRNCPFSKRRLHWHGHEDGWRANRKFFMARSVYSDLSPRYELWIQRNAPNRLWVPWKFWSFTTKIEPNTNILKPS